jgi:large subunit ribosomal protein L3
MWIRKLAQQSISYTKKSTPCFFRSAHSSVPGRTGLLAIKAGMLAEFDSWGMRQVLTVLLVDNCQVVQTKLEDQHGYTALQLGISDAKYKNVTKPLRVHYEKAGVAPKRKLQEFRIKPEAILPEGTTLQARHFVPGQLVDVCGISKGKGFQGAMKRHGFGGMRASHGVSKTHRALGSTGQCQDPGRVFKGKKMAGRMGTDRVTIQNLKVYKIDPERNLVYVKGHVPGNNGGFVRITDAVKGPHFPSPPPFPTYYPKEDDEMGELYAPADEKDPIAPLEMD